MAAALLFWSAGSHAQIRLSETPDAIEALIEPWLPKETIKDSNDKLRIERQLRQELPEILATEGYFRPELHFSADGQQLRIAPGPRTLIRTVSITIDGMSDHVRREALIAAWSLPTGMPFRQADWNRAKQNLLTALLANDYRGASLQDSRAEIDPDTNTADLSLHYVAGATYRFGPLKIEGLTRYDDGLIERYNHVVIPGQAYDESAVATLQSALQSSGYFASVRVETRPEEAEADADDQPSLPVHIQLRERPPHHVAFGMGASSNTGARVEAMYGTLDLFNQAWRLNTGLRLEERRQTFYSDLFFPPAEARYQPSIGLVLEKTDIANLQTERRAFSLQRQHQRGAVDTKLSLNWQSETKLPDGAVETQSKALAADGRWTWQQLDSLINPRHGVTLQARLGAASRALLSDRDFVRTQLRWQQYIPIGVSDTLSLRLELGRTFAEARDGIPEEYLFRAGGTNSVRGYAYNSLGVKSGNATVGGRYMGTASVEYTHWFDTQWGAAVFVDAGNAGDNLDALKAKVGAGAGLRWRSPAGPIAIDLARGQDSARPRLHFFVAIPF